MYSFTSCLPPQGANMPSSKQHVFHKSHTKQAAYLPVMFHSMLYSAREKKGRARASVAVMPGLYGATKDCSRICHRRPTWQQPSERRQKRPAQDCCTWSGSSVKYTVMRLPAATQLIVVCRAWSMLIYVIAETDDLTTLSTVISASD